MSPNSKRSTQEANLVSPPSQMNRIHSLNPLLAVILKWAGKDATETYDPIHPPDTLDKSVLPAAYDYCTLPRFKNTRKLKTAQISR